MAPDYTNNVFFLIMLFFRGVARLRHFRRFKKRQKLARPSHRLAYSRRGHDAQPVRLGLIEIRLISAAVTKRTKMPADRAHAAPRRDHDNTDMWCDHDSFAIAHAMAEWPAMPAYAAPAARLGRHGCSQRGNGEACDCQVFHHGSPLLLSATT